MGLLILKILLHLWPFIKEMILGSPDIVRKLNRNKALVLSIVINVMFVVVYFFELDLVKTYMQKDVVCQKDLSKVQLNLEAANNKQLSSITDSERQIIVMLTEDKVQNRKDILYLQEKLDVCTNTKAK